MSRLKHKLKSFFKTETASEHAVELLRMFIMPFAKKWDPNASVDDAVGAFFAVADRKIYSGVAKKQFRMLGQVMLAGNKPSKRFGTRMVPAGHKMLLVIDRKDQTAKIDITIDGKEITFLLSRPEMEYLKDYVEIYE